MRYPPIVCACFALLVGFVPETASAITGAVEIGTKAQLFTDLQLVRETKNLAHTLHPGEKDEYNNPLLIADRPWEGGRVGYVGTVLYDDAEKLFKMWYDCAPSEYFEHEVTCYATSLDGIKWNKPQVGTLPARNKKPHGAVAECLIASVTKDAADRDPQRRYKMVCYVPNRGFVTKVSPDGLAWRDESPGPIVPILYVEDVVTAFWHAGMREYVAFPRLGTPVFGRNRRTFYVSTSRDFIHWSKPELAFASDARDDAGSLARAEEVKQLLDVPINPHVLRTEFYGVGAYAAESCTIAFPWVFTPTANRFGNQEGPLEVQLASSRDLVNWSRPFRTPAIARDMHDEWDCGMQTTASRAIDVGDEVRLYYSGCNYTHGEPRMYGQKRNALLPPMTNGIGLATWKHDRFVSIDAGSDGGELTTVPITAAGKYLELNCNVDGKLVVTLLEAGGKPLKGFESSDPISGDGLRRRVSFNRKADISALAGKPICLRIYLEKAALFSYAFRN